MAHDFIRLPPDGVGKRIHTLNYTLDGNEVQVQGIHLVDTRNPENGQYVDNAGAAFVRFTEGVPTFDPLNRMKVAQSYVVGVYEHTNDSYDDLFWVQENNGGTSTYDSASGTIVMQTTLDPESEVRRVTNRYHYFQPSSPMIVHMSVSLGDNGIMNNHRHWGYFDLEDGWFYSMEDGIFYIVQRRSVSGTTVETKIAQADWSDDKLDGTGLSGITLDITTMNHYWIDIDFPVGPVSFGVFAPNGDRIICHIFENSNDATLPMARTASLPFKFVNENIGVVSTTAILRIAQCFVAAQGSQEYTFWRNGGYTLGNKTLNVGDKAILSIRPKWLLEDGRTNHINIFPECMSIYTTNPILLEVVWTREDINGTALTGDTWVGSIGLCEFDTSATAIDDEDESYTIEHSSFHDHGVSQVPIKEMFELNDEALTVGGNHDVRTVLSFVITPITSTETVTNLTISTRELW